MAVRGPDVEVRADEGQPIAGDAAPRGAAPRVGDGGRRQRPGPEAVPAPEHLPDRHNHVPVPGRLPADGQPALEARGRDGDALAPRRRPRAVGEEQPHRQRVCAEVRAVEGQRLAAHAAGPDGQRCGPGVPHALSGVHLREREQRELRRARGRLPGDGDDRLRGAVCSTGTESARDVGGLCRQEGAGQRTARGTAGRGGNADVDFRDPEAEVQPDDGQNVAHSADTAGAA